MLAKAKLNTIEILISKALIDWNTCHDEVVSIDNVLKEYNKMKQEIQNSNNIKWIFIVLNV